MWARLRVPLMVASAVAALVVVAGLRSTAVVTVFFLGAGIATGTVRELVTCARSLRPRSVLDMVRTDRGYVVLAILLASVLVVRDTHRGKHAQADYLVEELAVVLIAEL